MCGCGWGTYKLPLIHPGIVLLEARGHKKLYQPGIAKVIQKRLQQFNQRQYTKNASMTEILVLHVRWLTNLSIWKHEQ